MLPYIILILFFATNALAADGIIGEIQHHHVSHEETLYDIARSHGLGIQELLAANPDTDIWQPEVGKTLILPTQFLPPSHKAPEIVMNLSENRLYFFSKEAETLSFPISTGRDCCKTPTGTSHIALKRVNPTWVPPESIREKNPDLPCSIPPSPTNPLGALAMNLGWDKFVIHGTNKPWIIGTPASHGCIRMLPEDIAMLFPLVEVGMMVRIIDEPVSFGWRETMLYMDVHPTLIDTDGEAPYSAVLADDVLFERIMRLVGKEASRLDWIAIDAAIAKRSGVPAPILLPNE
jgi:L,D-transpeptidase ErfK/SrfK